MSSSDVLNNTGQNIFPNVTESERTSGLIRYRKVFIKKEDAILDNAKFFIDKLSTAYASAGDRVPRPYRYGYGVLDRNQNYRRDAGERKVYFEFSDYSTAYVFYENPQE